MAFSNLDFETTSGTPGIPANWTVTFVSTATSLAKLGGTSTYSEASETFEEGWSFDPFDWLIASSDVAQFSSDVLITPIPYDSFSEWDVDYLFVIAASAAAVFDSIGSPETVEDFEEEWLGGGPHVFDTTIQSSSIGDFDPGAGTSETFEAGSGTGWDTGYSFTITSSSLASFDSVSPENFEDFEETFFRFQVTVVNTSTNTFSTSDASAHNLSVNDVVTFENPEGIFPTNIVPGVIYTVSTIPSSSTFRIKDPTGTNVDLVDVESGRLYLVPDPNEFWTEELDLT